MELLSFAFVCAATAFVCTSVKDDDLDRLSTTTLRLFLFLLGGIGAFAVVIQVFTVLAG